MGWVQFRWRVRFVHALTVYIYFVLFSIFPFLVSNCAHTVGGSTLVKCLTIDIGFNGVKTDCGIAHILGILLMSGYDN